jgi:hypothetical protein
MIGPSLADSATAYALLGWFVFPLRPGTKEPFAGSRGFHDASPDPELVETWWRRHPNANVGLATGHGFSAVDIDSNEALTELRKRAAGEVLCWGPVSRTRRGWHLFFEGDVPSRAGVVLHVDVRGTGGYLVAPPSVVGGVPYGWIAGPETPLSPPSPWLAQLLQRPVPRPLPALPEGGGLPVPERVAELVNEHFEVGARSQAFFRLVVLCFEAGMSLEQTTAVAGQHKSSDEKYGGRLGAEVERAWGKLGSDIRARARRRSRLAGGAR